ncbi:MAG: DUF2791 family P-loop domain-containing protein [Hungatella sp.]
MFDMEARHVIEALRSGIPSRAVGQYFSEARPVIMKTITDEINAVSSTGTSTGRIISGKYGEGKTHLLNTVFNIAHENNMVVSYLSLSKETPFDKLFLVYQKLASNTFLPRHQQPGFEQILEKMTPNSPIANEMLLYAAKQLETDKLYYLLRSYLNTEDQEEKFLLKADLEGDFISNVTLKQIYKRIFRQTAKSTVSFTKTKHCKDYFDFLSHLFVQMGYNGWVILLDEAELIGRLGKKARLNSYANMAEFLMPNDHLEATYTMFALGASFSEDIVEGKHEFQNLKEVYPEHEEPMKTVLNMIIKAQQLLPLTQNEILEVLAKVQDFHGRAYGWTPGVSIQTIYQVTDNGGYLLRTKIRAAIEFLDQLYQYGKAGKITINELGRETFEEDIPSLEELLPRQLP